MSNALSFQRLWNSFVSFSKFVVLTFAMCVMIASVVSYGFVMFHRHLVNTWKNLQIGIQGIVIPDEFCHWQVHPVLCLESVCTK